MRRAALINSIWRLAWAIGLSGIQKIKGSGTARIAYPTEATVGVRAGLPSHGGQACATPTGVSVVMRIAAELVLMLKQCAVPYYQPHSAALAARRPCDISHLASPRISPSFHPPGISRRKNVEAGQEFTRVDKQLDCAEVGPLWLKDTRVADCVSRCLELGDSKFRQYDLHSFAVMANHVHLLLSPKIALKRITRNLKGVTARLANIILQRTSQPFWQDESYDHWCCDEAEFQRVRGDIAKNPVRAGLVAKPEQWPWSSAHRLGKYGWPGRTRCRKAILVPLPPLPWWHRQSCLCSFF